jgi:hypothetical protein
MTCHFWGIADFDHAIASGERALAIAAVVGDVGLQVATQCLLGQAYYFLGDYMRAIEPIDADAYTPGDQLVKKGGHVSVAES